MWQALPSADTVQDFIDYALAWLESRNYTLTVDVDMARWAAAVERTSPEAYVNPAFDPRHSRLSPETSFWLDVRAGSQTIATSTARLFVIEDALDLLRTLRLWFESPPERYGRLAISMPPGTPRIGGHVGHEGGLWVHPEHRKRGLSVILPHLNTALSLREWDIDWQTGITRRSIGESGIATWAYGFPHVEPCFDGYFPPTRSNERFYLCYMDREELTAGLDLDVVAGLLPNRHQQPRHAPALVQKR
jgi:GNAT superfamily N-acetyltransferase